MSAAVVRSNPVLSGRRIGAMILRYLYLLRGSWPRIAELAYWPTMQMILWGFITQFFAQNSSYVAQAFGVLLSGVRAGSAAEKGGLQRGDLLVELSGSPIRDIHDFMYVLRRARPGETATAVVMRGEERRSFQVTYDVSRGIR